MPTNAPPADRPLEALKTDARLQAINPRNPAAVHHQPMPPCCHRCTRPARPHKRCAADGLCPTQTAALLCQRDRLALMRPCGPQGRAARARCGPASPAGTDVGGSPRWLGGCGRLHSNVSAGKFALAPSCSAASPTSRGGRWCWARAATACDGDGEAARAHACTMARTQHPHARLRRYTSATHLKLALQPLIQLCQLSLLGGAHVRQECVAVARVLQHAGRRRGQRGGAQCVNHPASCILSCSPAASCLQPSSSTLSTSATARIATLPRLPGTQEFHLDVQRHGQAQPVRAAVAAHAAVVLQRAHSVLCSVLW